MSEPVFRGRDKNRFALLAHTHTLVTLPPSRAQRQKGTPKGKSEGRGQNDSEHAETTQRALTASFISQDNPSVSNDGNVLFVVVVVVSRR